MEDRILQLRAVLGQGFDNRVAELLPTIWPGLRAFLEIVGCVLDKAGDYVLAIGSDGLTSTDAWSGLNNSPDNWEQGAGIFHNYQITFDDLGSDAVSVVPVPGAVLLGMLGLSVAGIKLRRLA